MAPLFKSKLSEIKGKQLKKRVTDTLHTVERKFHIWMYCVRTVRKMRR
ncbi:hypothetical protein ALT1644_430033 [Alteromonas macleodii]